MSAFSINQLAAQETKTEKKIVVVEKTVDQDGKVIEKKIVKEGKEAEEYMKNMKSEGAGKWITKDGETHDLEGKEYKIVKKHAYKIVKKDDEGNEEVIEWSGEGEIPEDIKKLLDEEGIMIHDENHDHHSTKRAKVIVMRDHDEDSEENKKVFEWDGEGEMPEEMKELIEKEGINIKFHEDHEKGSHGHSNDGKIKIKKSISGDEKTIEVEIEGDEISDEVKEMLKEENIRVMVLSDDDNVFIHEKEERKAQLGVMIEDAENGVLVSDIIEGSAAEKAGMKSGDVITKVDGAEVNSMQELVDAIKDREPGSKVEIIYIRGGEPVKKTVTLQEYTWEEKEKDEEIEEIIIIKKNK